MKDEVLFLFDEDEEQPHRRARWVPFDDPLVPPAILTLGAHVSRTKGGRVYRCGCGCFHAVTFDDKGALVKTWRQETEPSEGP